MGALEAPPRAAEKGRAGARMSRRRKTRRALLEVAIFVLGGVFVASAQAQQTTPTQPGTSATPQDLAKSVHNPFEDFVKVPLHGQGVQRRITCDEFPDWRIRPCKTPQWGAAVDNPRAGNCSVSDGKVVRSRSALIKA